MKPMDLRKAVMLAALSMAKWYKKAGMDIPISIKKSLKEYRLYPAGNGSAVSK